MSVRPSLVFAAAIAVSAAAVSARRPMVVPTAPHVAEFGACVARHLPERARALMATTMDSPDERRIAARLAGGQGPCLGRRIESLSMHTGEFRGAVAEALLEADPEAMRRLRQIPPREAVRAAALPGRAFVAAYGRCLADADPARAAALLETVPGSAQERAAFLGYEDLLNDCMPMGFRYAIDTVDVRHHVAARLYDIAFPGPPAADR